MSFISLNTAKRLSAVLIVLLLFLDLNMFYHGYAKSHMDDDEALFQLYAYDAAQGKLKSPYLYGQDYVIPVESLLAAPLIHWGMDTEKALPLTCTLLSILPFLVLGYLWGKEGKYLSMLLSLSLPLLLPIEWNMMGSSARGFIAGIAIFFIGMLLIRSSKTALLQILGYFVLLCSVLVNPNTSILLVAFGLYHVLHHKPKYLWIIYAAVPWTALLIALQQYKILHRDSWVHLSWHLDWKLQYWLESLSHFNLLFKGVVPYFYELGALLLVFLVLPMVLIWKRSDRKYKILSIGVLLFLLFSFGINKVTDGTASVFFPYSRMFLGIPMILALFFSEWERLRVIRVSKLGIAVITVLAITGFGLKQLTGASRIQRAVQTNSGVVQLHQVKQLQQECADLKHLLEVYNKEVVVYYSKADALCYACSRLEAMRTIHPRYERRSWIAEAEELTPLSQVLLLDWDHRIAEDHPSMGFTAIPGLPWPVYQTNNSLMTIGDLLP